MAGTILGNIALGAADWSEWITRQERDERGHLRVSLTDMSDTTASTLAGGSILELAGSIYQFSTAETITLATGTASANTAVYFYVIPSAGGTTCTVVMDSTAPTWRDDYQGFYGSAASLSRAIGGCYIGAAGIYWNKFLYTPLYLDYCLHNNETRPLLRGTMEFGEWNMDAGLKTVYLTAQTMAYFGTDGARLRRMTAIVVRDDGDWFELTIEGGGGMLFDISAQAFTGDRVDSGFFDNTNFNATASTVANRGYIHFDYEA